MLKVIFATALIVFGATLIGSTPCWVVGLLIIAIGLVVVGFSMTGFDWMKRGL